jgi:hypothetical protein
MPMNPLVAYAMLPMSFLNLYRQRGRAQDTISIALAMAGLLVVNIGALALFVLAASKRSLDVAPLFHRGPLTILMIGVVFLEIGFVKYVRERVCRDPIFASRVQSAKPAVCIWYGVISCGADYYTHFPATMPTRGP